MEIIDRLATTQNRRDEVPNIELAELLVKQENKKSIQQLFDLLENANKDIQFDCIKVIYEIASRKPELISHYFTVILKTLNSKHNRLVWGGMTALSALTESCSDQVYKSLPIILTIAESGTVITKDHAMKILRLLCNQKKYKPKLIPLMLEQLSLAPDNQFPSYALLISEVIDELNTDNFCQLISNRLKTLKAESKRKTLTKILKKLNS